MTTAQDKTVQAVVDALDRTGQVAVVTSQDDGTVQVQASSGTERYAIVGKRGAIRWAGP